MARDITEAELLRVAQRAGCEYDSRDLKRFRQEHGILQRSTQLHEPGRKGSVSVYAPEALGQIRAICLGRKQHYRYDELRFHLWWDGHWVDQDMLRDTLTHLLEEQLGVLDLWRKKYGSIDDVANAAAQEMSELESRNPLFRLFRAQLGRGNRADLETFAYNAVLLAYGKNPVWDTADTGTDESEDEVGKAIHQAMYSTRKEKRGKPSFADLTSIDEMPKLMRSAKELGLLPLTNLRDVMASSEDDELELARDDARVFAEDLRVVAEAAEMLFGRGAFGLGMFKAFRVAPSAIGLRVSLVPMMVALRRGPTEVGENMDVVKMAIRRIVPTAKKALALRQTTKRALG